MERDLALRGSQIAIAMKRTLILGFAGLLVLAGCRAKRMKQAPMPPRPESAVVLLRDDDGRVGKVLFENSGGTATLSEDNTMILIGASDVAPSAPAPVDASEIARRFGAALDGLPAPQLEFVLYFELGTDRLTPQSEALVASLLQAVEDRQSTDVSITGHTDTTGTAPANVELGLRRAERVAEMLKQRGLAAEFLTVVSHGEGNLLVNTPDGVEEARNRRVEVTVR